MAPPGSKSPHHRPLNRRLRHRAAPATHLIFIGHLSQGRERALNKMGTGLARPWGCPSLGRGADNKLIHK